MPRYVPFSRAGLEPVSGQRVDKVLLWRAREQDELCVSFRKDKNTDNLPVRLKRDFPHEYQIIVALFTLSPVGSKIGVC